MKHAGSSSAAGRPRRGLARRAGGLRIFTRRLVEGATATCALAPVYVQDLTGDVARGLQEQDTVHDVADLASTGTLLA